MSSTSNESRITIDSESNPNHPKGKILNDNNVDVDHLGRVIYAEALAQQIEIIKSPVAVGIFSQWGTGKSFLLTHVQSILKFKNKRNEKQTRKKLLLYLPQLLFALSILGSIIAIFASIYFAITFFALLLLFLNVFFTINDINFLKTIHFFKVIFYALFTQLPIREAKFPYIPTTVPHKCTYKQDKCLHAPTENKDSEEDSNHEKSNLMPFGNEKKTDKKSRRFIYVNFNAWQYEGCDTLWAGIVTTMAEKIEEEFGVFTTRIFRCLSLDLKEKPNVGDKYMCIEIKLDQTNRFTEQYVKKSLKKYGNIACQNLIDWEKEKHIGIPVENKAKTFIVEFKHQNELKQAYQKLQCDKNLRVTVLKNLKCGSENNKNHFCKHFRKYRRTGYSLALLSLMFAFAVSLGRGISLLKTKQEPRLNESSKVVDVVLALLPAGVSLLYGIIKFIYALFNSHESKINKALKGAKKDFSTELGFMKKIKKEVQSMTNLIQAIELSHSIEYKVIITIDDLDRVPLSKVKSVLEAVSILLSDRNSPFICLIAIDSRIASKCFTVRSKNEDAPTTTNGHDFLKKIINLPFCLPEIDDEAKCSFVRGLIDEADVTRDDYNKAKVSSTSPNTSSANSKRNDEEEQRKDDEFELQKFLEDCREQMHTNKDLVKILNGNPRNLKRIFNVISMTANLIDIIQKRKNIEIPSAEELSCWIVLTEQWPYRMSYILLKMNIVEETQSELTKSPDDKFLFKIYDKIKEDECKILHSQDNLLQLDYDALILVNFLRSHKELLTKDTAYRLWKYTTNLDSSIMKSISLERDKELHMDASTKQNDSTSTKDQKIRSCATCGKKLE